MAKQGVDREEAGYAQQCISEASGSRDGAEYEQCIERPGASDIYLCSSDLLAECGEAGDELFELGRDELPAEIEDIRGKIRNESGRIFAIWGAPEPDTETWIESSGDRTISYFAIVEYRVRTRYSPDDINPTDIDVVAILG